MFKNLSAFILRSQMHAAGIVGLFGTLAWIFPLMSYLSCAALALVVLSKNVQAAIPVLIGAMFFSGLVAFVTLGTPLITLAMVLALWIPTTIVAESLRRTRSQAVMVLLASVLAIILALCLRAYISDVDAFWLKLIDRIAEQSNAEGAFQDSTFRQVLAASMNGIVAAGMSLTLILSVMIGRWWQSLVVNPGGFAEEFRLIRMPRAAGIIMALIVAYLVLAKIPLQEAGVLLDISLIGMIAFMLAGLAFLHQAMYTTGKPTAWLIGLYVFLFFAFIYGAMALAILGVIISVSGREQLTKQ